ncbi:MAG: hypothetical protein HY709_10580 [Candidatus Latescibacteria bacterium]|nr:hypothetical protein [Candidatus Latescibacterota bacterium]
MSKSLFIFVCAGCLIWGSVVLAQEKPIDFTTQIQPIFNENCAFAGCHAGSFPAEGMSLEAGKSYDNIVNVSSGEVPSVMRIKPFDPENSYLYRKIRGEQRAIGGSGSQMPLGGPFLSAEQMKLIEDWIKQGALKEPRTAVEGKSWGLIKRLLGKF